MLTPYFMLSLAVMLPKWWISGSAENITDLLLRPRLGVWGHFWFIPVLFVLYAILGFIRKITNGKNKVFVWLIIFAITSNIYFLPIDTQWFGWSDIRGNGLFFAGGSIAYLFLSNRCKTNLGVIIKGIWCFLAFPVSLLLFWRYNELVAVKLVVAILMITACWTLATMLRENRVSKWISAHNFTFYIYSWPFQAVMMVICERLCFSWQIMTPCMFLAGLAGPAVIIFVYDKCKWIQCGFFDLILGVRR